MTFIADEIDIIAASVVGRGHARAGRGSQDAVVVRRVGDAVVVVVCDGCSAGEASELGAGVGARVAAAALARRLRAGAPLDAALAAIVVDELAAALAGLVPLLGGDDEVEATIGAALLATLQVVVATPARWLAFGVGDGVLRKDGVALAVPAADDGAPDCVAYRLLPGLQQHARLVVHGAGAAWSTLTVGTDGAAELLGRHDEALPSGERFGGLPLFERDPRFARNPGLARKRVLALGDRGPTDDCTFVVLRRTTTATTATTTATTTAMTVTTTRTTGDAPAARGDDDRAGCDDVGLVCLLPLRGTPCA
jgi:hypothetical protein